LGEELFSEKRLSSSGTLSCASCHRPGHAYSDDRAFRPSDGTPAHRRNAPSVLNTAYRSGLGWEGNSESLEAQVEHSFGPYGDMGISLADALHGLSADDQYSAKCRKAYGSSLNADCLTHAIATFERSLVSAGSRFDRYLYGGDSSALTEEEKFGWRLFSGRGACIDCHDVFHPDVNPLGGAYATFSDERYHNLGVGYRNGRMVDPGRYEFTRNPEDFGAFKTPMLRNVSKTAPYMHDGSLATLNDVVDFYNRGGNDNPNKSTGLKPLYLSDREKHALVAFLKSLDSDYRSPSDSTPMH
jgi:cytochrome c peroxidase